MNARPLRKTFKISARAFNGVEWRWAADLFLKAAGKAFQNEILAVGFWVLAAAGMRPGAMVQFVRKYSTYCLREIRLQIFVAGIKPKHDLVRIVGCAVDAESRDDDIGHIHHDNVDVAQVEQYAASLCCLPEHGVQVLAESAAKNAVSRQHVKTDCHG